MWGWVGVARAAPLVFEVGQVFDGERFLGPRRVVVDGGVVVELGEPGGPADVVAPDATLTPGLVDGHLHLWTVPMDQVLDPERFGWGRIAEEYMSRMRNQRLDLLTHGVVAVVDLGTTRNGVARFRKALADGTLAGPAYFTSGPLFTAPGGHPVGTLYVGNHDLVEQAVVLLDDTPEAARAEVAALAESGMDVVKVVYDAGDALGYQGAPRPLPLPRLDLVEAVVGEAHARGLPVYAHVVAEAEALAMVRVGVDGLEHGFAVAADSPLFAEMAARGTRWTPTLGLFDEPWFEHPPIAPVLDAVRRAHAAGVPIAAGTDFPTSGGTAASDLYDEIRALERAGLDRAHALSAATRGSAAKIPRYDGGRIAPGARADLVLFDGDLAVTAPSADRVRQVWQGGVRVLDELREPVDPRGFRRSSFIPSLYAFYDPVLTGVIGVNLVHVDVARTGVAANLTVMASILPTVDATLDLSIPSPIPRTSLAVSVHADNDEKLFFGVAGGAEDEVRLHVDGGVGRGRGDHPDRGRMVGDHRGHRRPVRPRGGRGGWAAAGGRRRRRAHAGRVARLGPRRTRRTGRAVGRTLRPGRGRRRGRPVPVRPGHRRSPRLRPLDGLAHLCAARAAPAGVRVANSVLVPSRVRRNGGRTRVRDRPVPGTRGADRAGRDPPPAVQGAARRRVRRPRLGDGGLARSRPSRGAARGGLRAAGPDQQPGDLVLGPRVRPRARRRRELLGRVPRGPDVLSRDVADPRSAESPARPEQGRQGRRWPAERRLACGERVEGGLVAEGRRERAHLALELRPLPR